MLPSALFAEERAATLTPKKSGMEEAVAQLGEPHSFTQIDKDIVKIGWSSAAAPGPEGDSGQAPDTYTLHCAMPDGSISTVAGLRELKLIFRHGRFDNFEFTRVR
jgi:hypothetical protein